MKIPSPKIILLFLIIIFLIVNFFFLIDFLLSNGTKFNSKTQSPKENLKRLIDFNNTSYESKDKIFFYYNKHKQYIIKKNYTYIKFSFYFDEEENIIIDENNTICSVDNFDLFKCKTNLSSKNSLCIDKLKCCSKEYMCVYRCRLENKTESCEKICKENISTKIYQYKHCYFQNIQELNYTIIPLSNITCYQACKSINLDCYNFIISSICNETCFSTNSNIICPCI